MSNDTDPREIRVVGVGGEYMETVTVVEWHKSVGEPVAAGELVVTVETAKAATEIEAQASGILTKIVAPAGREIEVGGVLGLIGQDLQSETDDVQPKPLSEDPKPSSAASVSRDTGSRRVVASPLARRLARDQGVDLGEIVLSRSGRIKAKDVLAHADRPATSSPSRSDLHASSGERSNALYIARRTGSGVPALFIHGFGADGRSWQPLLSAMRSSQPTLAVDLPCHGRSEHATASDIRQIAYDLHVQLRESGVEEAHVVGHSLGGAVAICLCALGTVAVRSLCLLAPAGLGDEINADFVDGFVSASDAQALKPWLLKLVGDESLITPGYIAATMIARSDERLRARQAKLARMLFPEGRQAMQVSSDLACFHGPQRVIWGLEDRIIPATHASDLGGKVSLNFLPRVGHLPHYEAPSLVADLIEQTIRAA